VQYNALQLEEKIRWRPNPTSNSFPPSLKITIVIMFVQRPDPPSLVSSYNNKKIFFFQENFRPFPFLNFGLVSFGVRGVAWAFAS